MGAPSPRGAHFPTLTEVEANLRAGAMAVRDADLPDVAAWSDFCAAPGLVRERLLRRIEEGRCPAVAGSFPFPKSGKNEQRRMTCLDPYDDLYYRIITGRVAAAIDAALGPEVLSYRLVDAPPAWTCRAPRQAFELRQQRGAALLADHRCGALLITDIRHYFPSITPEALSAVLSDADAQPGAVGLITEFLSELQTVGAPKGLPVGPEASGLLGNIAMLPIDGAVATLVSGHVRYTDDSWLFVASEHECRKVLDAYSAAAAECGLEVNTAKVEMHPKDRGAALRAMQHDRIAYLTSDRAGYHPPEMALFELQAHLDSGQPDWDLCRFHLGSLRHHRHPGALEHIYEHPTVMQEIPRQAGAYILALADDKQTRRKIDRDWLLDQATGAHEPRALAGQLQLCRVANRIRLGQSHGERMEQLALDSSCHQHVPLRAWAAAAWGSSRAHSPARAVEYACGHGDFSLRRAFTLTVHPKSSTTFRRSQWRRKLIAADPDLAPTLERLQ
ncbi:RNA-directed DNA polymerase [Candidatus Poriferisodalis sp.]|uniref:RNA-directed DNA polymerase n=1 Tax=Candidatus Poriferisodalis sp. TaxID=3101277 RepID=UPI003B51D714